MLNEMMETELREINLVVRKNRKSIKRTVRILQQLIDGGFEFRMPYTLNSAFIHIEREDLPVIRKILREKLVISFRVPADKHTIKVYVHPESAPDSVDFWYEKEYHGKGKCKIVKHEQPGSVSYEQFVLVCES